MGGVAKILSPITSLMGGGEKETPVAPPPPIPEPTVMPDPDDKAAKTAARRRASKTRARSGRLSTINTDPGSTVLG